MRDIEVGTSIAVTMARLWQGRSVAKLGSRPKQPLVIYEFENCPFCRVVREALTALDLDAEIRPCPKGGHRFRDELVKRGGKAQFPYLIDPNTDQAMYESRDIIRYLFAQYGVDRPPALLIGPISALTSPLASAWRYGKGTQAEASKKPVQPLELWSFEASPFCRLVREKLSTLELPYRLHNVGKGSPKRAAFLERTGQLKFPYLIDPNTDTAQFESAAIIEYLNATYRV